MPKLKRPLYGGETGGDVLAIQRALNAAPSQTVIKVTKVYDTTTELRMVAFQKAHQIDATGNFGQKSLDALWPYFDRYGRMRYIAYPARKPAWQDIGPIVIGGPSELDADLTHKTDGIPFYPAYDMAFNAGQSIIACEDMTVDNHPSSSHPGHAFYATGRSEIKHWYGHLDRDHPLGTKFRKGQLLGKVIDTDIGGGPHCHHAWNVEELFGPGKQLLYGKTGSGPDYTHGSPTIREQLSGIEL